MKQIPQEIRHIHSDVIKNYVRQHNHYEPKFTAAAIKASSGNCGEMAVMCKQMLDLYLRESLASLGYHAFTTNSFVFSAGSTGDHMIVMLECTFQGNSKKYFIDPWSEGKAWTLEDGMRYFQNRKQDRFTNSSIKFGPVKKNDLLNLSRASMIPIFDKFGVKEQLDLAIQKSKSEFLVVT